MGRVVGAGVGGAGAPSPSEGGNGSCGAVSKSRRLLFINTAKQGCRGNHQLSIFIETRFPGERLRLEHVCSADFLWK